MKKLSVQDFVQQNPFIRGKSKLEPFKDDIFFLKNEGYSIKQIMDFLSQNGLSISKTALDVFIKKHNLSQLQQTLNSQNQNTFIQSQEDVVVQETSSVNQAENSQADVPSIKKTSLKKGIKKFDWKNASTEGLI